MHRSLGSCARNVALLLVISMALLGCTSKYGTQTTQVNYYPQCYQPVSDLRADESAVNKSTGGGAVAGALLGALIGGLVTGRAEGALVGAAAGGATGAVAGHAYGKSQQRQRDQQQLNTYLTQLQGESANMDRATAAAKVAAKCYNEQFQQAVGAVRAGQMTKPEFTNRYTEIRSGLEETARILNNTSTAMAQKDSEYQQVLYEETGQTKAPKPVAATPPSTKKPKPVKKPVAEAPPPPAATPRAQEVADNTGKWQQSRDDMEETRRAVQDQLNANAATVAALEG